MDPTTSRPVRAGRLRLETLEPRLAPAFTIDDTADVLAFVGDDDADTLVLTATATEIRYQLNGGPVTPLVNARPDTVTSLTVHAGGGSDRIDLSGLGDELVLMSRARRGGDVVGGDGDDTLIGTAFDDSLDGGAGGDRLDGRSGDDVLRARDFTPDVLDGGTGHDSAYFESSDTVTTVEVHNPFAPAADNQVQKLKVLVLNFDPLISSQGNQHLYELFPWWNSPQELAEGYQAALERASGGYLQFEITEWRNINEIPVFYDGFQYEPNQYYQNRVNGNGWHETSSADVPRIILEQNVVPLVDAGLVDEVWFFGDHFFAIGGESFMMGPGSFFINGPTFPQVPSTRPFVGYGFSYERGVAEMLHNTGHRTENHGNRAYGGWNLGNPQNNWDKFSANVTQSNGVAGVGTTHYPPNATGDYDYGNATVVQSWADDYLDYPNLNFTPRPVDRQSWAHGDGDYQRTFLEWYFGHMPRAAGIGPDGKQANWMKYIWDYDNYLPGGAAKPFRALGQVQDLYNLGGADHTFRVAYSSPIPIDFTTIDSADVRVTGPNGFDQPAQLVGVSDPSNGTHRVATYAVAAPGGSWDAAERGQYTITLGANQVVDAQGAALASQVIGVFRIRETDAEELTADADTSLMARFDGDTTGVDGETPSASSGVGFAPGLVGEAVDLSGAGYLRYANAQNIDSLRGTVEFWIRPNWDGDLGVTHIFFEAGSAFNNGMLLAIDGANNLRFIQWGDDPATPTVETSVERGVGADGSGWQAGEWHHFAAAWDGTTGGMSLHVDGQLQGSISNGVRIDAFSGSNFTLAANQGNGQPADARFDEFRISTRARSGSEIRTDFEAALALTNLVVTPNVLSLAMGDGGQLWASAGATSRDVSGSVLWTSSDPTVATVDGTGKVRALGAGTATITATLGGLTATADVTVMDNQRPTATLQAIADVRDAGGTELLFTVVYADDTGLRSATFDERDVWVHSTNGFSRHAAFVSATPGGDGQPRTATYRIVPRGATWDDRDNGAYIVEAMGWQVEDLGENSMAAGVLGGFTVDIGLEPPTDLLLSNDTIDENLPADAEVGTLSALDATPGDTFTYLLVDDAGGRFAIVGDRLEATGTLDHEAAGSHAIRVRATDAEGNWIEEDFVVRVGDVNERPDGLQLSNDTVFENVPFGTPVGDLWATDPDVGDLLQFTLVAGVGDDDNASFTISNGRLVTNSPLNYEQKETYSVRVRVTDEAGLFEEAVLVVTLVDENPERPTMDTRPITMLAAIPARSLDPAGTLVADLLQHADDEDAPLAVGMAVTGPLQGRGTWEFSSDGGTSWTAVAGASPVNALLLHRDWRLRFLPLRKFKGLAALQYRAWDGQTGAAGGSVDPATAAFAFSQERETAWVAVGKTKPRVAADGATILPTVREDAKAPRTMKVKKVLGIAALEQLPKTRLGIALTSASSTDGIWQYKLAKTKDWLDVGVVSAGSALLLRPSDKLRFMPNVGSEGAGTLVFHTWDQGTGVAGAKVDPVGGSFGREFGSAILDIVPRTDGPG